MHVMERGNTCAECTRTTMERTENDGAGRMQMYMEWIRD